VSQRMFGSLWSVIVAHSQLTHMQQNISYDYRTILPITGKQYDLSKTLAIL